MGLIATCTESNLLPCKWLNLVLTREQTPGLSPFENPIINIEWMVSLSTLFPPSPLPSPGQVSESFRCYCTSFEHNNGAALNNYVKEMTTVLFAGAGMNNYKAGT